MNGVLIYAFNNDRVDYFRQATWCADRVNRYLDLPVTIVTDSNSRAGRDCAHNVFYTEAESGGTRLYQPGIDDKSDQWFNSNRYQSYDISPYEKTLVIDSDYVVCSDKLLRILESDIRVTAMKNVYDLTNRDGFRNYRVVSPGTSVGLHHFWATVLYFDRSDMSRDFFIMIAMIKKHYGHYADLYGFLKKPFRNDFAVSIALNTLYGHVPAAIPTIPWAMASAFSDVEISSWHDDTFEFVYKDHKSDKYKRTTTVGEDFHFMNKVDLAKLYDGS